MTDAEGVVGVSLVQGPVNEFDDCHVKVLPKTTGSGATERLNVPPAHAMAGGVIVPTVGVPVHAGGAKN